MDVVFFLSSLIRLSFRNPRILYQSMEQGGFPSVQQDQVREHLKYLKIQKSLETCGVHPGALKDLDKCHSILFLEGRGNWDWFLSTEKSTYHQGPQYNPGSPALILGMMMEQIFMEAFSKHLKNKKVVDKYLMWNVKKMEPDSSQCSSVIRQEAMGTH